MRLLVVLLLASVAFAGCASPNGLPDELPQDGGSTDNSSAPAPGFAPQQGFQEDIEGDLHLASWFAACDAGYCINATATNEGSTSYHVSNICVPPHDDRMERDGERVEPREPRFYCQAFGLREWTAGEDIEFAYTWDGKLWDDERGQMVAAPEGAYQWTILFHAYDQQDGGDKITLEVTHTVIIGET